MAVILILVIFEVLTAV